MFVLFCFYFSFFFGFQINTGLLLLNGCGEQLADTRGYRAEYQTPLSCSPAASTAAVVSCGDVAVGVRRRT